MDPQHLGRAEQRRAGDRERGRSDERQDEHEQVGDLDPDELLQVVVHQPALLHRGHDCGEVVIGQNHLGRSLGDVGAGDAHCDPDVGRSDGRRVVHAVASHRDDVAFALENNGIPRDDMVERVTGALEKVQMDSFLNQEPHNLSGGQKQRVAIAGVIALRPLVIILDEATSMLDPRGREEVLNTVRELKADHHMTVISITHDLEEAAKADRMIVMNKGKLYREGTPEQIFQMDEELIALGLDMPFPVKMSKLLKEKGIRIDKPYLTEEELVAELWTSHFNR